MLERVREVIRKEFIEMLRDPRMRLVMFVVPVFQMLIFGFAASTDVRLVKTAVYDLDNTQTSRSLVRRFSFSPYFRITRWISREREVAQLLDAGKVTAVIRLDRNFGRDVLRGGPAQVQVILDGTDSNTAGIVLNYAQTIVRDFSLRLSEGDVSFLSARQAAPGVDLRPRAWFNENLESRLYLVPGVVAMVVLIVTLLLTAMSIVREKERGTIEQLIVSPIRPIELILGKFFPYALVGVIDVFAVTLVAVTVFRVPVRGDPLLLFACACLFLLTTLGTGLFISTISHTMQEAQMTIFFFAQPMVLLSGFVFPVANMPLLVQWITVVDPLKYFVVTVRGLFLKGVGIGVLWPDMLAMFIIGSCVILFSSLIFRKTLA